jgi:hypothetical protein
LQSVSGGAPAGACSRPINDTDFNVFEVAPRDLSRVVKLVAGGMPDQSDPHQVLASFTLAQDAGVHVGHRGLRPFRQRSSRGEPCELPSVMPAGCGQ